MDEKTVMTVMPKVMFIVMAVGCNVSNSVNAFKVNLRVVSAIGY